MWYVPIPDPLALSWPDHLKVKVAGSASGSGATLVVGLPVLVPSTFSNSPTPTNRRQYPRSDLTFPR